MSPTSEQDPRDTWDAIVDGWARHHAHLQAHTQPVSDRMLELAGLAPGTTVLELAAGLGDLSREAAARVAPDGEVLCSDASPRMVEAARGRLAGIDGVHCRVLDAHDLDLPDDAVDVVLCKMGLMLLPEPGRAVAECRRVLRPGGRLVAATWGPAEDNLWIAVFGAAMLTHGHAPPDDPSAPGGIFSLSSRDALTGLLAAGGFDEIEVETVDVPERVEDLADYWRLRADTSGPLTAALQELDPDQVDEVRASCEKFAAGLREEDGGYRFPGRALVTLAR